MAEGKHIELALHSVYTTFGVCIHQCFHTCQHIPSVPRGQGWWNICHATCMWGFLKSTFNRSWGCLCNFSVKDCDDYCTFSYTCCLTFENSSARALEKLQCLHASLCACLWHSFSVIDRLLLVTRNQSDAVLWVGTRYRERRLYQRSKYIHTVQVYFYVSYSTSVIICIYVVRVIFIIESWFDKKRLLKWWIIIFLQGDDVIKYRYSKLNYKTSIEALSVKKNKEKGHSVQPDKTHYFSC